MNNIFVKLIRSPQKLKKYRMNFYIKKNDKFEKIPHNDFGGKYYEDFTIHKDKKRKENCIARHKKRENWNKFYAPGALSKHILWNKPTIKESLMDYLNTFDLKLLPK